MPKTLTIQIETDQEEELYPLLRHVFKEITECDYKNFEIESNSSIREGWLEIMADRLKGKYRWQKD